MTTLFSSLKTFGAACLLAASSAMSPNAHAQDIRVRLGHVFAIGSPQEVAGKEFAELVKTRSNGQMEIALFPAGQLGGDEALGRELARGSLDLAFLNVAGLTGLDPLLDIHYLPYAVSTFEEADRIHFNPDGIIQKTTRETLRKRRIEPLAFFELEFRSITNSQRPVATPEDLRGMKLRTPSVTNIKTLFEAAGAHPLALPFPELFTALQQGTVDGQDNGPALTYTSRLFEAQKYMTLTNHIYAIGAIASSERFWKRLNDEQKAIVLAAAEEAARNQIANNRKLNREYVEKIRQGGVAVIELDAQAMRPFRELGRAQWDKLASVYGAERIQALRDELAKNNIQ
ncbi:TRAP transporter solute receptor, DctP family [Bordetella bronchiseptica F2]|uniref:TRAP transporter substrate-binding protein n=2 Tax=Bordetella bronchiseptica TaxID=518 RepID=UPI00045B62C7|nr:TRAP transporter substrate-binding protein [Bordetella bronchiseptica]KCV34592.1 TRAP transporter solute receptor, DctP family [Bordetella bronchiseptica 00-P-2730]KDC13747.1 TRAP transporter solute receptor, DctP family [Bordetella bronchiseptica F-1]KDC32262.1 TRAP transporter solute receptor, DctP family [Bordetella bronchiseptica F2]KDD91840.1 TRAP transporter solute receptor, DctP family [Bordetella bronchiseptica MO275]KDD99128.1 TRAP transporter solute receptor, DctP family [Bordetel